MRDPVSPEVEVRLPAPVLPASHRTWAHIGALFLLAGAVLLRVGNGLAVKAFALVALVQGAKALSTAVELQFGRDAEGRRCLARSLFATGVILAALAVAAVMG